MSFHFLSITIWWLLFTTLASANTEIINAGPIYCHAHDHDINDLARNVSSTWITLTQTQRWWVPTSPTLFSITPDLDRNAFVQTTTGNTAPEMHDEQVDVVPRADEGYWIALQLRDTAPSSSRTFWHLTERFTLRLAWPANHPLDFHLSLHTPESMLRAGGRKVEKQHDEDKVADDPLVPCSRLYLHLYATSHGVRIPRSQSSTPSWLVELAEWYMNPLHSKGVADAAMPTPLHLTLEPLLLGVLPQGLFVSLASLGVHVVAAYLALSVCAAKVVSPVQWVVDLLENAVV